MRLLILGYSSIAERRVIPAAGNVEAISEISIASRSRKEPNEGWPKRGCFYSNYRHALDASGADAIYLSLPNALHEEWAFAALGAGKHVIVDKPAFMSVQASQRAVAEARQAGLLLAEATVFTYHPHVDDLRAFVHETGPITHVSAQFIIPPPPISNFRSHSILGGGCLLDMGPYAAGLVRVFGNGPLRKLYAMETGRHPQTDVDMGFSMLAQLANGAALLGHFSFQGEYQNRLIVVSRCGSVAVERVFSLPFNHRVVWQRRVRNIEEQLVFDPCDSFARFLGAATHAIETRDHEPFYRDLLADMDFRALLSKTLESG